MPQDSTPKAQAQHILDDSRQLADDARQLYETIREDNPIIYYYEKNPYAVLGAAAGVGYLLGGGLFTPFTRRLLRIGLRVMAVPAVASQIRELASSKGGDNISIGDE